MNPTYPYPHQPPAPQPPAEVRVRHKPYLSIMMLIAGALGLVAGALSLTADTPSVSIIWIVVGPLFLANGIMSFTKPVATYDMRQWNLYLYNPLGIRIRTYGAAKGERIVFDGTNIMRLCADGSQKRVNLSLSAHREDLQRLQQTLWSLQQQPPAGPPR
ncbi:hypothetical protein [Glycomyces tenuis]|uniref:hypothetical protein n=1 Tax=Glycomyces tenuis TaxID=58116 RepID=UPI000410C68C|nr:hypothetical protein [Glycomyces tenuis]